jgi:hypothetical protein
VALVPALDEPHGQYLRPMDVGAEHPRLQRRLPLLPYRATAADRSVADAVPRLFVPGRTAVDAKALGRSDRRDADRLHRPPAGQTKINSREALATLWVLLRWESGTICTFAVSGERKAALTKRILLIIPTLDRCGAEKQLTMLACGLPRDRFEVHVCVLTRDGPLRAALDQAGIAGDGDRQIAGRSTRVAYWRLYRTHSAAAARSGPYLAVRGQCLRAASRPQAGVRHVVAGERCVDPWKRWHELAIDRFLARRTHRMVTNSQGVVDFYASTVCRPTSSLSFPTRLNRPSRRRSRASSCWPNWNCRPADRLIAAVNRLWPQKSGQGSDLGRRLAEGGSRRRPSADHRRRAAALAVAAVPRPGRDRDRVHFWANATMWRGLMPHFDCLWLASQYEGQSNAVLEAMAAGVPVVATDIAGNRDLVVHDRPAFWCRWATEPVLPAGPIVCWTTPTWPPSPQTSDDLSRFWQPRARNIERHPTKLVDLTCRVIGHSCGSEGPWDR